MLFGASCPDVLKIIAAINRKKMTWRILGFIDDTPEKQGGSFFGYQVLGGNEIIKDLDLFSTFFFNNVYRTTAGRKKVACILDKFKCQTVTLIHPDIDISMADIGTGVIIEQQAALGAYTTISDFCCIKRAASIGHENILEKYVFIGPGATLCGRVIAQEAAYIGAGSCILENVKIGKNSIIGAGSLVNKNVPSGVTVIGSPAKPYKKKLKN